MLSASQDGAVLLVSPLRGNPRDQLEEGTKAGNPIGKETSADEWEVLKKRNRLHAAST